MKPHCIVQRIQKARSCYGSRNVQQPPADTAYDVLLPKAVGGLICMIVGMRPSVASLLMSLALARSAALADEFHR